MRNLHEISKRKPIEVKVSFEELTDDSYTRILEKFGGYDWGNSTADNIWGPYKTYYKPVTSYTPVNYGIDWSREETPVSDTLKTISATCAVCGIVMYGILPQGKTHMSLTHTGSRFNRDLTAHRHSYQ